MFYKEWKLLAAHFTLRILAAQKMRLREASGKVKNLGFVGSSIYQVKKRIGFWYSLEILKDAAEMMYKGHEHPDNEIKMLHNYNDLYESDVALLDKGHAAMKEWKYPWMFLRSAKGLVLAISSFLTAGGVIYQIIKVAILLLHTLKNNRP